MSGEDIVFAELPVGTKKSFTVQYNNMCKSSIQVTKKRKGTPTESNLFSGAKFDAEVMDEASEESATDEEPTGKADGPEVVATV